MAGRGGGDVDRHLADTASDLPSDENAIPAVWPVPLHAVAHAAGRVAGTPGMADRPGIPVVQPCPRRSVQHPVLRVGNIEIEIAAQHTGCRHDWAPYGSTVLPSPGTGFVEASSCKSQQTHDLCFALSCRMKFKMSVDDPDLSNRDRYVQGQTPRQSNRHLSRRFSTRTSSAGARPVGANGTGRS
jgi:hypothetical protein